jgi:integrase/recombinase XerD
MTNLQKLVNDMAFLPAYSLRFFLRKSKKDPTRGMIYIRMTYENEKPIDLGSTKIEGYFKNFIYFIPTDKQDIIREIKHKSIVAMILRIKETINDLHPTTSNKIRDSLNGKSNANYEMIELIEKCKNESEDIYSNNTRAVYDSVLLNFKQFLAKEKMPNILVRLFTVIEMNKYVEYMKGLGFKNASIRQYKGKIEKATRWAAATGIIKENPLRDFKVYGLKRDEKSKKAIQWSWIEKLRNHTFIGKDKQTVDCFIFACSTGLSYIDIVNMNNKDTLEIASDGDLFLNSERQKIKSANFRVLIQDYALDILNEYGTLDNITPPDSSAVSSCIKSAFKQIGMLPSTAQKITFHSSRHTFITYCKDEKNIINEKIMKMTGHKDVNSLKAYIYINDESVVADFRTKKSLKLNI